MDHDPPTGWAPPPPDGDRLLAIAATRILDPDTGSHLTGQCLLVRAGTIEWIGQREALPVECPVIDLPDSTLLPGLIDAHVHLAWDPWVDDREEVLDHDAVLARALTNVSSHLARGVTTVRDLGAPSGGVLSAARAPQAGGSVLAAGRALGAPGGHAAAIARPASGPQAMRRAVEEEVAAGARCIKVMATGGVLGPTESPKTVEVDAGELDAIITAAHAAGVPVAVHAHALAAIRAAVEAGADSIEHASGLDQDTAELMAERGTTMVPTISPLQVGASGGGDSPLPGYLVGKARVALRAVRTATATALRCGVDVVPGTDAGVPGQEHGVLVDELQALAELGLSTTGGLRAATSGAADLLRARDRGRLRIGSRADLVVVAGDPTRDLGCLQGPLVVVQGGRVVPGPPAPATSHAPTAVQPGRR